MLAVGGAGPVELFAQRLHQRRIALVEAAAPGVGERPVLGVARVLHRRRVFVVDVDAVEPVRPDERDGGVREGVDARLVDRPVGVGRRLVEAAGVDALAVLVDVAAGLRPAAHGNERLHVGVLFLVLVEQVEMALVGEGGVHFGARDSGPGHSGRGIVRAVLADGYLVVRADVREGVVEVGDLVPRDVGGEIGGRAVLAGAPAGEVADDPTPVVGAHLLAAVRVVDRTVGDVDAGGGVEPVGATGGLVLGVRGGHGERAGEQPGEGGADRCEDGGSAGRAGRGSEGSLAGQHDRFLTVGALASAVRGGLATCCGPWCAQTGGPLLLGGVAEVKRTRPVRQWVWTNPVTRGGRRQV